MWAKVIKSGNVAKVVKSGKSGQNVVNVGKSGKCEQVVKKWQMWAKSGKK